MARKGYWVGHILLSRADRIAEFVPRRAERFPQAKL